MARARGTAGISVAETSCGRWTTSSERALEALVEQRTDDDSPDQRVVDASIHPPDVGRIDVESLQPSTYGSESASTDT